MAVEEDGRRRLALEERQPGAKLINKESIGGKVLELVSEKGDMDDEMELAQDGAEDGEAAEYGCGYDRVSPNSYIECAFSIHEHSS